MRSLRKITVNLYRRTPRWDHQLPQSPGKTGEKVNGVRYGRYVTSLDGLPIHTRPPVEVGPFGESEIRECAKARQRSQSGPVAASWLRARLVDAQRVIPAQELPYAGRRHLGIEEHSTVTCSACGAAGTSIRHARLCHRAGAHRETNASRWSKATSRFLKRMSAYHQVSGGKQCAL